jgi:hypothetical protein
LRREAITKSHSNYAEYPQIKPDIRALILPASVTQA